MNKEEKEIIEMLFEVYGVPAGSKLATPDMELDDSWLGFEVIPFLEDSKKESDK